MKKVNYLALAKKAAAIADEKKGEDIVLLNVAKFSSITDYVLIVTASSTPQMNAIIEEIHKTVHDEFGIHSVHREGRHSSSWSILDYGGAVIHVMSPDTRQFYNLERMWPEARRIKVTGQEKQKSAV